MNKGGDGGDGGYIKTVVSVNPGQSYSIVVGSGGSLGQMYAPQGSYNCSNTYNGYNVAGGQNGGNGGVSSFDGIVFADGGDGGTSATTSNWGSNGADGGITNLTTPNNPVLPSYIPSTYLTAEPTGVALGGNATNTCYSQGNYLNGREGENGFCVISY